MSLCFIDPADAIRAIADSIGREARRQLLGEAVRAWVDEIPDDELEAHYAKAISELDEHDISMLAAWHASMDVGTPIPNRDYLMGAFPSLGQHRREALKLAAGFRGEEAVDRGVTEERALETVLEWLSRPAADGARGRSRRALRLGPGRQRQLTARLGRSPSACLGRSRAAEAARFLAGRSRECARRESTGVEQRVDDPAQRPSRRATSAGG